MDRDAIHPRLFDAGADLRARRLGLADAALLQAFIDANPEYWLRVSGAPPRPDEAEDELQSRPPPELGYREHVDIGFWREGADGSAPELLGFAIVDSDLGLPGCWHLALFVIATRLHGSGLAARCYGALEDWARAGGARWLRLGVVRGNAPAERFWERQGFVQLRLREGVAAGARLNTVRVMLKPLAADAGIDDYLARVERDRPIPRPGILTPMARFMFAWEHGGGLGHAGRLKPLALALRERGHDCALLLRDLVQTRQLLDGLDLPLLQAPLWLHQTIGLPQPLVSLPEILRGNGYLQPDHLDGLLQGWLSALRLFGAEAVIGDYAPTAVLAARIAGLPCATLGIGFYMPPARQPMPAFRDWEPIPPGRVARSEAQVLAVVNAVLARHGCAPMGQLSELFHGDRPLLNTWPELDHYDRQAEGQSWWGPSMLADTGAGQRGRPVWPAGSGPRVFAYLKTGHPEHAAWLAALAARGCRVLCYLPEVASGKPAPVVSPQIHYAQAPVDLGLALKDCELLVCHGGEATLVQGLLAGVPLLLLPMQPEQFLISRAAARTGAAINVAAHPRGTPPAQLLARLLDSPEPRAHARAFAARHAGFSSAAQTAALADQFEALLAEGRA